MTNHQKLITLLAAHVYVLAIGQTGSCDQSSPATTDETVAAVRAANDQFYAALNSMFTGELAPMEEIWSHADDVTYLPPSSQRLGGWQEVRAAWQQQAQLKLGGTIKAEDVRIIVASPTVAVVTTTEVGHNLNTPAGRMDVRIRATKVYRLEDGNWKVILHHADALPGLIEPTD